MAVAPAIPTNVVSQQANAQVLVTWNVVPGATSYSVQRSLDSVNFTTLGTSASNSYLDSTVTIGTQYWYQVASVNSNGTSAYSSVVNSIPVNSGDISLGELRAAVRQRADMVNSQFVTDAELNSYINSSYFELYDLLVTAYESYYLQTPYVFQTTGVAQYTLPTDFYKLVGVDGGVANNNNAYVSLHRFNFIDRNQFVFPQLTSTLLGITDLRYDLQGNTLYFIPTPNSSQYIRVWYIPKLVSLLKDTDILAGVSGWWEYVLIDAAIKCLQKQESDVQILAEQKMGMIKRIQEASAARDTGQTFTVSDSRNASNMMPGLPFGAGYGGY